MIDSSYIDGLIHGAMYAAAPWRFSPESVKHDNTTQDEKDFCLSECPYAEDRECCERCDGHGRLKTNGRPRKEVDITRMFLLYETMPVMEVCREIGISKSTLYRIIRNAG